MVSELACRDGKECNEAPAVQQNNSKYLSTESKWTKLSKVGKSNSDFAIHDWDQGGWDLRAKQLRGFFST